MNNNFYQNQAMYGQQPAWNTGYQQQVRPIQTVNSTLTDEEIKFMRSLGNPEFNIKPTEPEFKKGKCNHHHKDGTSALTLPASNPNASPTTKQCDMCFTDVDLEADSISTQEKVNQLVDDFCNLQEVIKFSNLGMPSQITGQLYGNIIPYNRKMKALYTQCANALQGLGMNAGYYNRNGNLRGQQVFNTLNGGYINGAPMMNQGMMNPGMMQQPPMMNPGMMQQQYMPYQQQQFMPYQQQQMMNPGMMQQAPQQANSNPFYADQQQAGFYTPANAQQQAAQPASTMTDGQTVQQPTPATTEQTVRTSNV